ncbi:ATP-binding cassette domain-containing protein [Actinokineospora auranticolor]|uniref:ABC-2 type transport system ATP-binding protein n=1 Tax=Actinokineospora auranticolor TaxID=155976 RepID=A0A2S6GHW4_9PSEU|nr:ATP-binding cassette domain-containing protein [Actinokineospora auranticolor]PPK64807.1 ABC-2 type transport system ATP-binding protein [Actinokineospora auranticolor]
MIEADELTKTYGRHRAVDRLTFRVLPGRVTGFLGPNGAGKSTTIRLILGLDSPTHGRVRINGRPYRALTQPLRQVGALLDAHATHGGRRARDHLLWLAQTNDIPRGRVAEVLRRTGLTEEGHRRVGGFSLGMKQRLGIAAALLGDPQVLIFDEPVNGLDPDGVHWIRGLIRSLAAEGRTVLISSHLMSEMQLTADHVLILARGRLLSDSGMADLVRSDGGDVLVRTACDTPLATLLTARGATVAPEPAHGLAVTGLDPAEIAATAATHGIALVELTPRPPSLEEVFRRITDPELRYRAEPRPQDAR